MLKYVWFFFLIWNASWICVSSLCRGHANLLCIIYNFSICAAEVSTEVRFSNKWNIALLSIQNEPIFCLFFFFFKWRNHQVLWRVGDFTLVRSWKAACQGFMVASRRHKMFGSEARRNILLTAQQAVNISMFGASFSNHSFHTVIWRRPGDSCSCNGCLSGEKLSLGNTS